MIEILSGPGTVKQEFPGKYILFKRYGIEIDKEPMLIYPTLHYQNGGLSYDNKGKTSIPGLFVAGEVGGGFMARTASWEIRFSMSWFSAALQAATLPTMP